MVISGGSFHSNPHIITHQSWIRPNLLLQPVGLHKIIYNSLWVLTMQAFQATSTVHLLSLALTQHKPEVVFTNGQLPCLFKVSPDRHQALLQLDQVAYWFLVHALLQAAQNLVIDRVEVWNVRRPQVRWNEIWCFVAQQFDRRTCNVPVSRRARVW